MKNDSLKGQHRIKDVYKRQAQAQADLANCKNALANAKPEVKEVTKEVEVAGPLSLIHI